MLKPKGGGGLLRQDYSPEQVVGVFLKQGNQVVFVANNLNIFCLSAQQS